MQPTLSNQHYRSQQYLTTIKKHVQEYQNHNQNDLFDHDHKLPIHIFFFVSTNNEWILSQSFMSWLFSHSPLNFSVKHYWHYNAPESKCWEGNEQSPEFMLSIPAFYLGFNFKEKLLVWGRTNIVAEKHLQRLFDDIGLEEKASDYENHSNIFSEDPLLCVLLNTCINWVYQSQKDKHHDWF